MAMWMNRAGRRGEWEKDFLRDGRIYLQWEELAQDLSTVSNRAALRSLPEATYPNAPKGRISSFLGQIWIFVRTMELGDWVGLPSKLKRAIHFGEITGPYQYDTTGEPRLRHYRTVNWFAPDVSRSTFSQDLLYGFGPPTICGIAAEDRIRSMASNGWRTVSPVPSNGIRPPLPPDIDGGLGASIDLEESARDEVAALVAAKFKGHRMALLVEEILKAQGYTTYRSPEGPDYGVDILAAPGPLGFGQPKMVVQVKSGDSPVDRATVDQLIGTMQNFGAEQGLFVSWGGFKSSVDKETARQFFRVRLWDQSALIDQILANYDKLDEDLRADLPLKRIWTVAQSDLASSNE